MRLIAVRSTIMGQLCATLFGGTDLTVKLYGIFSVAPTASRRIKNMLNNYQREHDTEATQSNDDVFRRRMDEMD